ncbi:unnamed protein product, partial [Allacma fusca]
MPHIFIAQTTDVYLAVGNATET